MTIKISLRLSGLDLRDDTAYKRIPPQLQELGWEASGDVTVAIVYTDETAPPAVRTAARWAELIKKLMPGVTVTGVYDELVSSSDIAHRAGVTTEAVRLWATGKRRTALIAFPPAVDHVGGDGGRTTSVYAWRKIVPWVRQVLGTDLDEGIEYLTDARMAELNAVITSAGL
jgi:hypothetical protein